MTVPTHSAFGMLLAYLLSFLPWWIIAPLAYLSHYLLDLCPHWEKDLAFFLQGNKRRLQIATLVELLLAIALYAFAWWQGWKEFSFLAAAIAAGFPDIKHLHPFLESLPLNGWHEKAHCWWQKNPKRENEGGPSFQLFFIIIFVIFVLTRG